MSLSLRHFSTKKTLFQKVILDEDNMVSNSDKSLSTQQSIKAYVDSVASGLDVKESCRVATTDAGNLTSGFAAGSVIDDITLITSDRILIKNQTDGSENGIYTVNSSGAPTRALNFDENSEVTSGAFTFIEEGTTNADAGFVLTTDGSITVGSTSLAFSQFSGAGQITGGDGLTKTGNTIDIDSAQTEISSILNTNLIVGRDADDQIKFGTANQIDFRLNGNDLISFGEHFIAIKNNNSDRSKLRLYCETNTHYAQIQAPAHSSFSGGSNTLTLPAVDDTLVGLAATQVLTNKTLTSPIINTSVSGTAILDENDFSSNSSQKLATQASIKAYVDAHAGGVTLTGTQTLENKTLGSNTKFSSNPVVTLHVSELSVIT